MTSELVLGRRSYSLRARAKSTQRWNRDPGFLASAIDGVGSRHDFLEYFSAERISNGPGAEVIEPMVKNSGWCRGAADGRLSPAEATLSGAAVNFSSKPCVVAVGGLR